MITVILNLINTKTNHDLMYFKISWKTLTLFIDCPYGSYNHKSSEQFFEYLCSTIFYILSVHPKTVIIFLRDFNATASFFFRQPTRI